MNEKTAIKYNETEAFSSCLRETQAVYLSKEKKRWPRQGSYTIEDYYDLPPDERVELIDGVFYDMAAPTTNHQLLLGELYVLFRHCIEQHGERCKIFLSPCDVQLDRDRRTMLQPDLFIICSPEIIHPKVIFGVPDLIVEILSPSTSTKDRIIKWNKYHLACVKEYWIVDPEGETVTVHDFANHTTAKQYTFRDDIPIGVSSDSCSIPFSRAAQVLL